MKYFLFTVLVLSILSANCQTNVDKFVSMTYQRVSSQESATGVKPAPLKPLGEWSSFARQDMDGIWQRLSLKGVNYYSLGEPKKSENYSQRSDSKSPYYQAWFGTYVIDAKNQLFDFPNEDIDSKSPNIVPKLLQIAVLDQSAWLYAMKDPGGIGSTSVVHSNGQNDPIEINVDGHSAHLIEFSMTSHSDLTDSAGQLISLIGMPNKQSWQGNLDAYHPIMIRGFYIYWFDKDDGTLKIIYGAGCSYTDKQNVKFDFYPQIKDGMLKMAKQLTYVKADS